MAIKKDYLWPFIGIIAVALSIYLLYHELRGISYDDIVGSLLAIPLTGWILSALATLAAYIALAGYDSLALQHLNKKIRWRFISLASFTAYAIGHNLGASVFSGGMVRYRAYSSQGLNAGEIGVLVAFCSFTFTIGCLLLGGIVLVTAPEYLNRFYEDASPWIAISAGTAMLSFIALYVLGSLFNFKPLRFRNFQLAYPNIAITFKQLLIGALELLAAAAIIHFALPAEADLSYWLILGIFLASFSAALISHAPGGLGVLELAFLVALPDIPQADVLAALLVFRLFYLLAPLAISLIVVVYFEREQWLKRLQNKTFNVSKDS